MKLSIAARHNMSSSFGILWLALFGQSMAVSQPVEESKIYWSQPELGIHRSNLDGSDVEPLVVPDLRRPDKIALDIAGGKMYWTERVVAAIHRSDLDGSNLETLVKRNEFPNGYPGWNGITGIALDVADGKMYWLEYIFHGDSFSGIVAGANLDGSEKEILWPIGEPLQDIALDLVKDKVYWSNRFGTISCIDLYDKNSVNDESFGAEDVILGDLSGDASIALDVDGEKIYWILRGTQAIRRADLDGTNAEIVLTVSEGKLDEILLLDVNRSQMYWTNAGTQAVQVADLDGNNVESFFDLGQLNLTGTLGDIALDLDGGKIYYTDTGPGDSFYAWGTGTIHRIDLDGQNGEVLFDPRVRRTHGIALDRDKIYWTDAVEGTIHRANLNGRNRQVLFSGLDRPRDIALLGGHKIYWVAQGTGKIQAAGLDGSPVEDIVTGLDRPKIIDLDHSKIIWTDGNTVFCSDLDGSHQERITTIDMGFLDIILDRDRSKIYWTNNDSRENAQSILRSNLDGSHSDNISTVDHRFSGSNQAITLDPIGRKIYWTGRMRVHNYDWNRPSPRFMEIFRSNLDGSNVEPIHNMEIKQFPSGEESYQYPPSEHYPFSDITLYIPHPTSVSTTDTSPAIPTTSGLGPNFPNPFNAGTLIPYKVATPGVVRLDIYNLQGQPVRTLVDEFRPTGAYHAQWDTRDGQGAEVAAGVYFARLQYPGGVQTRRLLYLK